MQTAETMASGNSYPASDLSKVCEISNNTIAMLILLISF